MGLLIWKYVKEPAEIGVKPRAPHRIHFRNYFSILRYRNIRLCCAAAAGFVSWLFLTNAFAPLLLTEQARLAPTTAGFLLGASGLGSFFSQVFSVCALAGATFFFFLFYLAALFRQLALLVLIVIVPVAIAAMRYPAESEKK